MIVTRQRKRRTGIKRVVIPLFVLAVLGFVLAFPPSQHAIANGPLKPAWDVAANVVAVVARPFSFAAQQQSIADRNREIRDLNARLEQQRQETAAAQARVDAMQQQLTAALNEPRVPPLAAAHPTRSSAPVAASADDRRLAATWAAMDPDKAAAVIQRLPDAQAVRVLAQMDADSAGAIMNALPAKVAARLSRSGAQVSLAPDR
jgi:flagellar motility protein MotE (MotC chaperone)